MSYREGGMLEVKEVLRLWIGGVHEPRTRANRGADASGLILSSVERLEVVVNNGLA